MAQTVQEIEIAAMQLRRENKRFSVRNVRAVFSRSGSYIYIGPVLAAWKAKTNHRLKELPKDVPVAMAAVIEEFATKLWAVAREKAEKVVERRMLEQAELEREFEKEAAVAWAEVDRLAEEVKELHGMLRDAGVPIETVMTASFLMVHRAPPLVPPPVPSPRAPSLPPTSRRVLASDTFATQRFWEGVLSEVTLVLEASGKVALTSREIFDALAAASFASVLPRFAYGFT